LQQRRSFGVNQLNQQPHSLFGSVPVTGFSSEAHPSFGSSCHPDASTGFAWAELQYVLALLLQRFHFAQATDQIAQPKLALGLWPKSGLELLLQTN